MARYLNKDHLNNISNLIDLRLNNLKDEIDKSDKSDEYKNGALDIIDRVFKYKSNYMNQLLEILGDPIDEDLNKIKNSLNDLRSIFKNINYKEKKNMEEIRMTKEEFEKLKFEKLDYDVEISGVPQQIVKVKNDTAMVADRDETKPAKEVEIPLSGYKLGKFAYPLNEEMTYENTIHYNGYLGPVWSVTFENGVSVVSRNGKTFSTMKDTDPKKIIATLEKHPLNLNMRDFDKKAVGRKLTIKRTNAVVKEYIDGKAEVVIVPDGASEFPVFPGINDESPNEKDRFELTVSIFADFIEWK